MRLKSKVSIKDAKWEGWEGLRDGGTQEQRARMSVIEGGMSQTEETRGSERVKEGLPEANTTPPCSQAC